MWQAVERMGETIFNEEDYSEERSLMVENSLMNFCAGSKASNEIDALVTKGEYEAALDKICSIRNIKRDFLASLKLYDDLIDEARKDCKHTFAIAVNQAFRDSLDSENRMFIISDELTWNNHQGGIIVENSRNINNIFTTLHFDLYADNVMIVYLPYGEKNPAFMKIDLVDQSTNKTQHLFVMPADRVSEFNSSIFDYNLQQNYEQSKDKTYL